MSPPPHAWWLALRPRTLPAGIVPVWVGSILSAGLPLRHPTRAWVATACALLIQVGTNLYNDYADFVRGADTAERLGPRRATQQGWLRPAAVRRAALGSLGLAGLLGLYLCWCGGWPIVAIGAPSLLLAIGYTGGPYPLAYHGLGEAFVFLFFGVVAVCGSGYLQTASAPSPTLWVMGSCIGLLASAVLVVNNLRDIATDARSNKRTLAVRFGAAAMRRLYVAMLAAAYLLPLSLGCSSAAPRHLLWPLLSLPFAVRAAWQVGRLQGAQLNGLLGRTAQLELLFGALAVAGAWR